MQVHDYTKPPRTMPHTFARQGETIKRLQTELDAANDRIVELTKALATMNERQRQEWARAENAEAWAQAAYTRLQSLMTIGVSMTPDAVTKRLLENAPEAVKGGEK